MKKIFIFLYFLPVLYKMRFCSVEDYRMKLNDSLKLSANIELCKVESACPNACPPMYTVTAGATYTISETIHTIMSIESSYLVSIK